MSDCRSVLFRTLLSNIRNTSLGFFAGMVFLHQVNLGGGGDYYNVLGPSVLFSRAVRLGSVVNLTISDRNWPKNAYFASKCLQQSLDFRNRSFSSPGVLACESRLGCAADSAIAELGSGAIAAYD